MRCLIISFLVLFTFQARAFDYPKHMVQVTTRGLGVGAGYEKTDPSSDSQFKDYDVFKGNVALNYAYTLRPQLQAGGLLSNYSEERDFKTKQNGQGEITSNNLLLGVFAIWNFKEELRKSWYTGLMFSFLNHEEESSNKTVFYFLEDDKIAETFEAFLGKRFSLEQWGISNITFSPSLSFYIQRARKDYEDDGLQDNMGLNIEAVKFDVLF